MHKITNTGLLVNTTMNRHPIILSRSLENIGSRIAMVSVPVIVLACLAIHECAPTTIVAKALIIVILVLSQVFLIACLQSHDIFVFSIMLAGLISKVVSASLQAHMARWGSSDALMYFDEGRNLADNSSTFWDVFNTHSFWGTELIAGVTACIFRSIGSSLIVGMILFTIVSFWGQYLYFLAHRESFPSSGLRRAILALFFWPSILFWSSSLGKDALMLLFLGLASFSMAKLSSKKTKGMFFLLAVAVCGSFFIRPHIAAILIISVVASFHFGSPVPKPASASRKIIKSGLLLCFSSLVVYLCVQFLQLGDLVEAQNHIDTSVQSNELGRSGFDPGTNPVVRVALAPLLLIRPFPWEVNGIPAALTSVEGCVLLALAFYKRTTLRALLKSRRAHVFVVFLLWFVSLNILLMGIGESNFGLLARQRVMVLPMLLMLLFAFTGGERTTLSNKNV